MAGDVGTYRNWGIDGDVACTLTMRDPDGIVHDIEYIDAVYWRPPCGSEPYKIPKGGRRALRKRVREPLTCLVCLGCTRKDRMYLAVMQQAGPSGTSVTQRTTAQSIKSHIGGMTTSKKSARGAGTTSKTGRIGRRSR